ncbi:MAG: hypothetical protein ACI4AA_08675 [Lachnospiraceae bacterium]
MKEKTVLRTILSLTLAAFLLSGCGNSKETPAEEVPTVAAEEEVTEEPEKEEQDAQQPAEEETPAEEEVAEEPKEEETSNDMPEAQVTTTVENFDGLVDYMVALDPETPHIVIYNEAEGYIIDMKEGEHYQLKSDDRIFINSNSRIKQRTHAMPELKFEPISGAQEIIPDYSKFDKPQKCAYGILCEDSIDDELTYLICYLDPPIE